MPKSVTKAPPTDVVEEVCNKGDQVVEPVTCEPAEAVVPIPAQLVDPGLPKSASKTALFGYGRGKSDSAFSAERQAQISIDLCLRYNLAQPLIVAAPERLHREEAAYASIAMLVPPE